MEREPKIRVLVVDDDEDTMDLMRFALTESGCFVSVARSFAQATSALNSEDFDAVVTDLSLPDGSGHELLASCTTRRPRVAVALTGYSREEDRLRSVALGFDEHMVKPVVLPNLVHAIRRLVRASAGGAKPADIAPPPEPVHRPA